jgi:hypothetical protein
MAACLGSRGAEHPARHRTPASTNNARFTFIALALALGFPWQNGCLQQIAAKRLTIPQDVIAILLQGFVLAS